MQVGVVAGRQGASDDLVTVVGDVNAVPPPGVDGMELFMDGAPLPGSNALGVGPLAIGDVKYKTESGLFKRMISAEKPGKFRQAARCATASWNRASLDSKCSNKVAWLTSAALAMSRVRAPWRLAREKTCCAVAVM